MKVGDLIFVLNSSSLIPPLWNTGIIVEEQQCLVYDVYILDTSEYGDIVAKQYKVLIGEKFEWHCADSIKEMI